MFAEVNRSSQRILSVLVLVVMAVVLVAPTTLAAPKYRIGFSQYTLAGTPWWSVLVESAKKEAAKNGVELIIIDGHDNMNKQLNDVEDLISKKVNLIIINPKDPVGILPAANAVHKAKIPLIGVDTPMDPKAKPVTTVMSDNAAIGYMAGWELAKAAGKRDVKAVLMSAQPGDKCGEARRWGFINGFVEYQLEKFNGSGLQIVQQGWGNWSYDDAQKVMEEIVLAKPDIDVVFAENDAMAIGVQLALKAAKKKVLIGAVDGQKEFFELIKRGEATATGLNSPSLLGVELIQTAISVLKGERVPSVVYTKAEVITKTNVDKWYDPKSAF